MSEHTPGPWRAGLLMSRHVFSGDGSPVALSLTGHDASSEEAAANARLIATAPEMLVLLRRLRRFVCLPKAWEAEIDAVVAKAEAAV